ncbi:phage tail protein, partial [Achromobacter xylosoxidans]
TANARVLASRQADAFRSHTHTYNGTTLIAAGAGSGVNIYGNYSGNTTATGGSETRPENVAFHPRIHA